MDLGERGPGELAQRELAARLGLGPDPGKELGHGRRLPQRQSAPPILNPVGRSLREFLLGAGYYWYVSMGGDTVAVAKGPSPHGPWSDPLGKPFLSRDLGKSLR